MADRYHGRRSGRGSRSAVLIPAIVLAGLILMAAAVVTHKPWQRESGAASSQSGSASGQPDGSVNAPDTDAFTEPARQPDISWASYDFSQPAPEREAVDNHYFDDAAFVGDSRTDGFMIYSGIGTGKNLTSNGLSIFSLETKKALTIDGEKYTLLEALALEEYGKVYLSLGVNELGYDNDEGFYRSYGEAVEAIRSLQPNAVIYIQGLIPLNEGQIRERNGNKYNLTNEHLRVYNSLLKRIAEEKQVVYLDLYSEFADGNDELPAQDSRDGVHLQKEPCRQWLTYVQTHTVDFKTLYPEGSGVETDTLREEGSGQE